ncbi:hypothetical protein [Bartonella queenslandensis]|uniref:hypothetical protein n=1 Tax=Bartonella queenslandensis TaxID=481138 RepID=UPI001BA6857B|nr:hypothetical protein [Bartonella queenslandensis]
MKEESWGEKEAFVGALTRGGRNGEESAEMDVNALEEGIKEGKQCEEGERLVFMITGH